MTPDGPESDGGFAGPFVYFRGPGVSILLHTADRLLPRVVHWGADLGELSESEMETLALTSIPAYGDSPFDVADQVTVIPEHASGWIGRPGLEGSRLGRDWSAAFRTIEQPRVEAARDGGRILIVDAGDEVAKLGLVVEIAMLPSGLVRSRAMVTNKADDPYAVGALRIVLPVPEQADELMDFTGRHTRERIPQRQTFNAGLHSREVHTGRTGLDAAHLLMAGRAGFGFRSGEVWAVHVGWSGNQELYAERIYNGARMLGGGERLENGEIVLGSGDSYQTPWLYASYGNGIDAVSHRFHAFLRATPTRASRARPVVLNTWEAVYFDQDIDKLTELADLGAYVGAERFVLDDGWFGGRRDDRRGLGDWSVSPEVWPDGLGPLVDHVVSLGMEFGIWVEPEMVNLDSDLARRHPEWVFSAGGRVGLASRYEHVLDLGHPGAFAYIRDSLDALLTSYDIAYLKWDHNRYLNDAGHTPNGEPGIHAHTAAVYRLMDELRANHPGLEIESCAGGGGRIDLGVLERTDRVWPSDCIDPLERQQIHRYTQLLVPPELVGMHIASPESHTTHRRHDLQFRAGTAVWGHLGIEWDLTRASQAERDELKQWVAFHKEYRRLLHSGTVVNVDHPDPAVWISGVVAPDRREALFGVVAVQRSVMWPPGKVRLVGLDPDRRYDVSLAAVDDTYVSGLAKPPWTAQGVALSGRSLEAAGVQIVAIHPEHIFFIRVEAVD